MSTVVLAVLCTETERNRPNLFHAQFKESGYGLMDLWFNYVGDSFKSIYVKNFDWAYFEQFPDVVNSTFIRSFSGVAGSSSTDESSTGL